MVDLNSHHDRHVNNQRPLYSEQIYSSAAKSILPGQVDGKRFSRCLQKPLIQNLVKICKTRKTFPKRMYKSTITWQVETCTGLQKKVLCVGNVKRKNAKKSLKSQRFAKKVLKKRHIARIKKEKKLHLWQIAWELSYSAGLYEQCLSRSQSTKTY